MCEDDDHPATSPPLKVTMLVSTQYRVVEREEIAETKLAVSTIEPRRGVQLTDRSRSQLGYTWNSHSAVLKIDADLGFSCPWLVSIGLIYMYYSRSDISILSVLGYRCGFFFTFTISKAPGISALHREHVFGEFYRDSERFYIYYGRTFGKFTSGDRRETREYL